MKFFVLGFTFLMAVGAPYSDAAAAPSLKSYLPENDWYIPATGDTRGVSESEFNSVIDQVESVYGPIVAQHGGNLVIRRNWQDGTVNAYASREGSNYVISLFGGLARHDKITKDGFMLVICHELGHHIGGTPKSSQYGWASIEGQSDYYSTLKCFRKVARAQSLGFLPDLPAGAVPDEVTTACNNAFEDEAERAVCARAALAGLSGASLFSSTGGEVTPRFDTPDRAVVTTTYESHPKSQCRLDTYFQAAICPVSDSIDISSSNPNTGTCNYAAGHSIGTRPLCWYKPTDAPAPTPTGTPEPTPWPEPTPTGGPTPTPWPQPTPEPGTVANAPLVNGYQNYVLTNPNTTVYLDFDVSTIPGAAGGLMELSRPNAQFSNPNGNTLDTKNGLLYGSQRGNSGRFFVVPANQLPGWGIYQVRTIALDANGRPVGRFSNTSTLTLRPY